ncbi:uncharacterized protein LOC112593262 [Melanaphis sacchari]|uniref:uncharacterized protein LOC112593262 n=1 Tax=Melanaphis sacchari TaxID=742174 RepID=UPI000DC156CF|nr:uncharacterized protein LOC112593262 [Melanaphis sacchari]
MRRQGEVDQQARLPLKPLGWSKKLLRLNRRLKIRETTTRFYLPKTTVCTIAHDELNFRKVCKRWVPKMINADHKNKHMWISLEHLNRAHNDKSFLEHLIIAGYEAWVPTPCNKRDSTAAQKHTKSSVPKKCKQFLQKK